MRTWALVGVVVGVAIGLMLSFAPRSEAADGDRWIGGVGEINARGEVRMDPSVNTTIREGHWSPSVAVTDLNFDPNNPITADRTNLSGWRNFALKSSGLAVTCCFTFDASNPVTTSSGCSHGWPFLPGDVESSDQGLDGPLRAACTGATSAGANIAYRIVK